MEHVEGYDDPSGQGNVQKIVQEQSGSHEGRMGGHNGPIFRTFLGGPSPRHKEAFHKPKE